MKLNPQSLGLGMMTLSLLALTGCQHQDDFLPVGELLSESYLDERYLMEEEEEVIVEETPIQIVVLDSAKDKFISVSEIENSSGISSDLYTEPTEEISQ